MKFYDRTEEIAELRRIQNLSANNHSRMTVVTGRRRIGKTSLICRALEDSTTVYLFVSRDNESVLVKRFTDEIKRVLDIFIPDEISSFRNLFTILMQAGKTQHFNLVIDEFQEFYYVNSAIFSHIQDVWDRYRHETFVNFVVCGSAYRMMNRIFEDKKEPLFGRRDALLKLNPFKIDTIKEILKDFKPDYSSEDLLALYTYTGGVPKYVELFMDDGVADKDAMISYMIRDNSLFVSEGKNILIEEFGKDYGTYFSILGCISTGINTQAGIEAALGNISAGGFLKRLMEDYSLISKIRPFGSSEGSKNIRYEIADNFLRFWFKYIHKDRSIVEIGNWNLLRKIISDDYTTYTGDILERYFRQKMIESMNYRSIGNWWNPKNKENQCEIDIIAITADNKNVEIYEVKRNPERYKENVLKEKIDHLMMKHKELKKYSLSFGNLSMKDM
ncbi:ATP-binding protein [Bacteroides sp.]|uniref:ATP-binding protein n=1 Tax=Bacteroides sp. TaxID=29523 RepID=UPI0025C1B2C2|nr:ATP-binding protein [Bacteroides sp.]